jgi:inner membrane transporter RhtA
MALPVSASEAGPVSDQAVVERVPPHAWFVGSAVFHYLGPGFAVLLFARLEPLGVAWLRIASAAVVLLLWRRPWQAARRLDPAGRWLVLGWGLTLAAMNACFYLAIDRLPLGTVGAIEFVPVVVLAAAGARSVRNLVAVGVVTGGVWLVTDLRLAGAPLGFAFAAANAALFAGYVVLGHRVARRAGLSGLDGLALAMGVAAVAALPLGLGDAAPAFGRAVLLAAGIGVGLTSSVVPYVCDQLAMARLPRASYALLVALLPATATVVGLVVLGQVPTLAEAVGVGLVVAGVAVHRRPG